MMESREAPPDTPVPFGGTVTIFFSDIRGFTDYTEQFGDEAAYRILREHNAIVRKEIEAFGGVVVKTQGDSFMVAFKTARGAIQCAIAIQRAITESDENQAGPRIAIGIGINTGEPIQEGGDYFGSMVNLTARICASAGPGQILVAETTRHVAGRIEAVEYVDRGLHELKGFPEAKRLCEVIWRPPDAGAQAGGEAAAAKGEEEAAALTAAVQRALAVLNRVIALTHLDDPAFGPLIECQAKAGEFRLLLSRTLTERRGTSAKQVQEAILPFESLLALVTERDKLDEERWAQLDAGVARAFGRPLVTAVARGRLSAGAPVKPEPAPAAKKPEPAPALAPPRASAVQTQLAPLPPDPRVAGVRWWAGAYAAWSQWKPSGLGWAHALRGELAKHPYLLSVHVRASVDYDDGQLAGGYFLLVEHIENQSPRFTRTVVDRAVDAAGGALEPRVLGPKLYELLVDGGRLRATYPAFVRDIVGTAIPNPGVWADGGVVEHEDATVVVTRPTPAIGETQERAERLTEPKDRAAERHFDVTLQPLTTRFFYVKPGELKTPRDLEIRLAADGQPSDRAWYITLRTSLLVRSEPKLLPTTGVSLPGLGREHAGAWVALFNPEPDEIVTYELTVTVRQPRAPMPAASPFARR
ncbi:MAG: adenylate/guanylate cyclase domain-containing protein [Candidatus Rokubacteria bacterium]|nr:adenylate/guanylate cyclase domain-containing protein [Candidatus Rokubacteria bacterium]MBI2156852.1 adenylate/guanylate cyclase domain-containing protein [Candidatus Rokubacteria bacterium]